MSNDATVPTDHVEQLRGLADAHFPDLQQDLENLVRIDSVSMSAFDQTRLQDSAEAVMGLLRGAGVEDVEIVRLPATDAHPEGRPAVLGHLVVDESAPTVLLYAHHDVQPPGNTAKWTSTPEGPFVPVEKNGRLYGRGAADDKAGIIAHLGALRLLKEAGLLGVNVRLFIEGEEEIGSPTFRPFLEQYRDRLEADVIVVADSNNWRVGVPALTTSLRGVVGADVTVSVLDHAVHSGMFGGPVLDSVTLLARLIATLHDEQGNVAVEGLRADVHQGVAYDEADYRTDAGVLEGVQLAGVEDGSVSSALWTRPALAVVGLDATSVERASNTIIPSSRAKLSLRVAPGQDPREASAALKKHLEDNAPLGAHVEVEIEEEGPAFRADPDAPALRSASWALGTAFGNEAVQIGVGGSIPFISDLREVFPQAQILVTGVEDPDSRAHSENESVDLSDLRKVVLAEALLLTRLAAEKG